MPPAVATAALIAAAARALHEAGHAVVAEALSLFLAGADFEAALALRPGWRVLSRRFAGLPLGLAAFRYADPILVRAVRRGDDLWLRHTDGPAARSRSIAPVEIAVPAAQG